MSEAYERELHRELSKLEGSFRQWQNEEIGSGELSYRLHQYEVGPSREFRGPKIPLLARRIAGDGFLNTAMIGRAGVSLSRQPELWRDWGTMLKRCNILSDFGMY